MSATIYVVGGAIDFNKRPGLRGLYYEVQARDTGLGQSSQVGLRIRPAEDELRGRRGPRRKRRSRSRSPRPRGRRPSWSRPHHQKASTGHHLARLGVRRARCDLVHRPMDTKRTALKPRGSGLAKSGRSARRDMGIHCTPSRVKSTRTLLCCYRAPCPVFQCREARKKKRRSRTAASLCCFSCCSSSVGQPVTFDRVERAFPARHPNGFSMAELAAASRTLGLRLEGVRFAKGDKVLDRPAIAFLSDAKGRAFRGSPPRRHDGHDGSGYRSAQPTLDRGLRPNPLG